MILDTVEHTFTWRGSTTKDGSKVTNFNQLATDALRLAREAGVSVQVVGRQAGTIYKMKNKLFEVPTNIAGMQAYCKDDYRL